MKRETVLLWGATLVATSFTLTSIATPRPPLPSLPAAATTLFHTRFDEPYWLGHERTNVVTVEYGTLVESFSGYALQRTGKTVVPFVVSALDAAGKLSIASDTGAVGFWFKSDWTSAAAGGVGPGYAARLVELLAVGEKQSAAAWSLQTSPDGSALVLVGADGVEPLLKAGIGWVPGEWHWVVINYGDKTELWLDGALAAEGSGTVSLPPTVAGLVLGSTGLGSATAGGEFEDVYAFRRPLTERQVGFYYQGMQKRTLLGPISAEEETAVAVTRAARKAELAALAELDGGAPLMRFATSGASAVCVTNGPVFLTNTVSYFTTNEGWTVGFDIAGGTNGVPYDIFSTTNLVGDNITNSIWRWEDVGYTCNSYTFTNQATNQMFYILGTPLDSDGDGLTDAYEKLVSKTDPNKWDTDGDGVSDGDEVLRYHTDPNNQDSDGDGVIDQPFQVFITRLANAFSLP